MKILYILNIAKRVNNFSHTSMLAAQELGMEYHIAGNWSYTSEEERAADEKKYGIHIHQIDFFRQPYHLGNLSAYNQVKRLVQKENFDIIHCNTPIGGVVGRLVGRKCGVKKVVYQAHGFHFYKGAPLLNWLLYYPVEKWLARYTDALITINSEDFARAREKMKLRHGGTIYYVPGVGIDPTEFSGVVLDRDEKRRELGLSKEDFVVISMGDVVKNKNYAVAIQAVAAAGCSRIHYLVCGIGPETEKLKELARSTNVEHQVHFLGFRSDIKELLHSSDAFLFTTLREGLPRSMMEAMAGGLPCIASKIRGNVDLLEEGKGGFLCAPQDADAFAKAITLLLDNDSLRESMGNENRRRIEAFGIAAVVSEIKRVYGEMIGVE